MREAELIRRIMLLESERGVRLFRNNCGKLQDKDGRWIKYGVANPGGSDLIGWTVVNGIAVFTAYEAKTGRQKPTHEQRAFLDAVENAGGIARVMGEGDV